MFLPVVAEHLYAAVEVLDWLGADWPKWLQLGWLFHAPRGLSSSSQPGQASSHRGEAESKGASRST